MQAINDLMRRMFPDQYHNGLRRILPQPRHKPRQGYTCNHSQGESKTRRKMAVASNRINRRRIARWKF